MLLLAETAATNRVDFQNIVEANGLGIAATGMVIVFVVLVLISGFIASLPKIMGFLEEIMPAPADHHGEASAASHVSDSTSQEEIVAAIGAALHARRK